MRRAALLSLVLILTRAHAAPSVAPRCDPGVEAVREVRAVAAGIIAADNARDIGRVLGYYSADAVLMPPGEEPVQGREAIRPRYEALFSGFDPEIRGRVDESCVGEGLAFVRGHNGGRLVSRQGGEDRLLDDAYLMVLRRDADGRWRISRLMWHRASATVRGEEEGAERSEGAAAKRPNETEGRGPSVSNHVTSGPSRACPEEARSAVSKGHASACGLDHGSSGRTGGKDFLV